MATNQELGKKNLPNLSVQLRRSHTYQLQKTVDSSLEHFNLLYKLDIY